MDAPKYRETNIEWEEEPPRAQAGALLDGFKKKKETKKEKKKNTQTEGSRRVKKEKKVEDKGDKTTMQTTVAVAAPQGHPVVEAWVQRALDHGVEKLRDEFRQLAKYTRPDMTVVAFTGASSMNPAETKNRYQDVPCQDQCIVGLQPVEKQSQSQAPQTPQDSAKLYIHANYVGTPISEKRFICTQGPLDHTIDDFWLMVFQQKVEQIIMLCKTIETGKFKCAQYWPLTNGEKRTCASGIVVENLTGPKPLERDPEIQVTTLNLSLNGVVQPVRHLHWTDWPDRGVPPCKLTSLELLSAVRGSKASIVVHCSAGIGRTGTIVAIEYILEKIAEQKSCPPMPDLVKALRDQRAYSIQNDLQYLYIHRVMLNYFLEKYKDKYSALLTADNISKYEKFIKDYNVAVGQT